jgi:hypothetical protein
MVRQLKKVCRPLQYGNIDFYENTVKIIGPRKMSKQ